MTFFTGKNLYSRDVKKVNNLSLCSALVKMNTFLGFIRTVNKMRKLILGVDFSASTTFLEHNRTDFQKYWKTY